MDLAAAIFMHSRDYQIEIIEGRIHISHVKINLSI